MELATTYHPESPPFPYPHHNTNAQAQNHTTNKTHTQTQHNIFFSNKFSETCLFHRPKPDTAATEMLSYNHTLLRQSTVSNTTAV
jgi:hypothetical protein